VLAPTGTLLMTWVDPSDGISAFRQAMAREFPGASDRQAVIIHTTLMRVLTAAPLPRGAVRAIDEACEEWSRKVRRRAAGAPAAPTPPPRPISGAAGLSPRPPTREPATGCARAPPPPLSGRRHSAKPGPAQAGAAAEPVRTPLSRSTRPAPSPALPSRPAGSCAAPRCAPPTVGT
jgi:hypothetical protein